ncbi:MAG: glutamate--tRNA ligase [Candidatus Nanohaloarchaea archaeon]
MELEDLARKYALKNAVEYDGECNPGAVIGQLMQEVDEDPETVQEVAGKVSSQVNQLSLEEQKEEIQEYEFEDEDEEEDPIPDLEDTEDGVKVRFAPNPNGPAHLGSVRGMVINGELKKKYDGELVLRFDDTDPETKRPLEDAYEMYKEDYDWLGYEVDEVVYSSDHFDKYIAHAEKLIEMGKAYVCECPHEKAKELKEKGEACEHRSRTPEENMKRWKDMRNGEIEEGEAALKLKTDLDHKNPAIRDFFFFRIIEDADHPRTGNEYRVYPTLDFAGAIEDHLMGTTHIFRGKDLSDSVERQKYVYKYFDWEYPNVRHWGRIKVSGFEAPMSTSSMAEMIENGELEGWDDPQCGTLRALRKRGFQPEAIKEFFLDMGVTDSDIEASVETLETFNTRVIDDDADRYFFVEDPIKITIEDAPEDLEADMRVHPEHPERGTRSPPLGRDGELEVYIDRQDLQNGFLRLKGLCNIELEDGEAEYREGDHTVALDKDADIIHWVPVTAEKAEVKMPNGEVKEGLLEPSDIEEGEIVQFERFGFVRHDTGNRYYYTHK